MHCGFLGLIVFDLEFVVAVYFSFIATSLYLLSIFSDISCAVIGAL